MILSEDRQLYFARVITDGLWNDDLVDYSDDDEALRAARRAVAEFVKEDLENDRKAREKVASLKRGVLEGTPEWDILYRKYYEEELNRRGKS
jgi:hypothetical protein